jgi:hypothetical protein
VPEYGTRYMDDKAVPNQLHDQEGEQCCVAKPRDPVDQVQSVHL